jgi:hypothetical protein
MHVSSFYYSIILLFDYSRTFEQRGIAVVLSMVDLCLVLYTMSDDGERLKKFSGRDGG